MKQDKQKFEDIFTQLEAIVKELDTSLSLEESLKKYEHGMHLARLAEERLSKIENEFHKIQQQYQPPKNHDEIQQEDRLDSTTPTDI